MLSQIPNFLSERLKPDTRTSPWRRPSIPHNASRCKAVPWALRLLPPRPLISLVALTPFRVRGPANPATLSHLCVTDPFGIQKAAMDPLPPDSHDFCDNSKANEGLVLLVNEILMSAI